MSNFYIAPFHLDNADGSLTRTAPLYYSLRFNPKGTLTGRWSLKDFDTSKSHCVLATETPIPPELLTSEFYAFPDDLYKAPQVSEKDTIFGFLADVGIDGSWIKEGISHREVLHRLYGMTQAMQTGVDAPDVWLEKPIYCGFTELTAFDTAKFQAAEFERGQALLALYKKMYPFPISWERGSPHWVMPDGRLLPVIQGGALPATDTFTGADGTTLTAYSANWTMNNTDGGVARISSNAMRPDSGVGQDLMAHWNADTFADNQYAQGVFNAIAASVYMGVAVRVHASAHTGYILECAASDTSVQKYVAGTQTVIEFDTDFMAVNDVSRLESNSTTLVGKRNGTQINSNTDSSISSGYAGLTGYGNATTTRIDNWEGGNLGLIQEGYRWRADNGSESAADWLAEQDVNINRDKLLNTRLRVLIDATGDPASQRYKLRYRKQGDDGWRDLKS